MTELSDQKLIEKLLAELEKVQRRYDDLGRHHLEDHHQHEPVARHEYATRLAKKEAEIIRLRNALFKCHKLVVDYDVTKYLEFLDNYGGLLEGVKESEAW